MDNQFILTPYFIDEPVPGLSTLAQAGWQVNAPPLPEGTWQERLLAIHRPLAALVAEAVRQNRRPVSVAGDCCTTLGVLAGLQQGGIESSTLIWFDAHGDFNTWETTPSGFLGGMPLAMLSGRGEQTVVDSLGLHPQPEAAIVLTDARDLDPGEREAVAGSGLTHLAQVEALLDRPLPKGPLYVHFDVDVLDPKEAPAMNYPAPGGPAAENVERVFRRLADSGQVAAVSLSSWNPALDADGRSRKLCLHLLNVLVREDGQ